MLVQLAQHTVGIAFDRMFILISVQNDGAPSIGQPELLPPLVAVDPALFALLRRAHTLLALVLFLTILMHFGAALLHAWIRRDGVFRSIVPWR